MKTSTASSVRLSAAVCVSAVLRKITSSLAIAATLLTLGVAGTGSFAFGQFGTGTGFFAGSQSGFAGGLGSTLPKRLNQGVALDGKGNIYMTNARTNTVVVQSVVLGSTAQVSIPTGSTDIGQIAVDKNGSVYVADLANGQLLKEAYSGGTYTQSVLLTGLGIGGVAVDASLSVYVGDSISKKVLKLTPSGRTYIKTTVASGIADPSGVAVDTSGNVYIADDSESLVLKETKSGSTYSQSTISATLLKPRGVAVDASGNVFVSDADPNYTMILEEYNDGAAGYGEAYLPTDGMHTPEQLAVDPTDVVYVADSGNGRVLTLSRWSGAFAPTAVGSTSATIDMFFSSNNGTPLGNMAVVTQGAAGLDFQDADPSVNTCSTGSFLNEGLVCMIRVSMTPRLAGPRQGAVILYDSSSYPIATGYLSGVGTGAQVAYLPPAQSTVPFLTSGQASPYGVAVDGSGNVYIVDSDNNRLLKETRTSGGFTESVLDGNALSPTGVAVDGAGIVYLTDTGNNQVLGFIPTGSSYFGFYVTTSLQNPYGVAVDGSGNVFVTDPVAKVVNEEQVSFGNYTETTLPTSGLHGPFAVAVDQSDNVYFTDNGNILKLTPSGSTFTQSTFDTGFAGPYGLAVDSTGNVYVSEFNNHDVIEDKITGSSFTKLTFPTSGVSAPYGLAVDSSGSLYVADVGSEQVYKEDVADAPALAFAATTVGTTSSDSPKVVEVENIGNANLSFSIPATGTNPSVAQNFSLFSGGAYSCPLLTANSPSPGILAAGSECSLSISFVPTAEGALQGSVVLADNNLNTASTQSVQLSGAGVAAVASLSATTLAFGNEKIGVASGSQSVTLTNTGNVPMTISSIAVTGTNASSFVFGYTCGTSLAAGANCSIHGHFAPVAYGALTAAITITDNATGSPQTIALTGTGVEPLVTLSAPSLSFAPAMVGSASTSQSVTVTNSGNTSLSISSIVLGGSNPSSFVFANSCGTTLAAGANCSIHGHFAPALAGVLTATITLNDSATGPAQSIALSGTGTLAPPALSATSLSFGSLLVGSTSASQAVTMTNNGTTALAISSIVVTGAGASSYVFGNTCGTSLAAGANCSIHGHFTPAAAGAQSATITITDTASNSPQSIALTGTGTQPAAVSLSATSLSFPSQAEGIESAAQTVTMTNTGAGTLNIGGIHLTGVNASSFLYSYTCGTTLAAGASCSIKARFYPQVSGAATAAITITDNAANSPQSIALNGTAQ